MMQGVGGGGGASSGGSGCVGYAPDKLILVFPMCQFGFGQSDYIRTVLYYRLQGVNIGGGVWYAPHKFILACPMVCQFGFGQSE